MTFNKTSKKESEESSFKIKSIRKIRSEKNILLVDEGEESKKIEKSGSKKVIQFDEAEERKAMLSPKVASKKHLSV